MLRIVEHGARVAAFDDAAMPHDQDAIADVVGGGEIVGEVDDRHAQPVAQIAQQVDAGRAQPKRSIIDTARPATKSAGFEINARAIATRCNWPPEVHAESGRAPRRATGRRFSTRRVGGFGDRDPIWQSRHAPGCREEVAFDPLLRIEASKGF